MHLYFLKDSRLAVGFECGPVPLVVYADLAGIHLAPRDRWLAASSIAETYEFEVAYGRLKKSLDEVWGDTRWQNWFWLMLAHLWLLVKRRVRAPFRKIFGPMGPEFVGRLLELKNPEYLVEADIKAVVLADPERFRKC